jgi:hypothetical protein
MFSHRYTTVLALAHPRQPWKLVDWLATPGFGERKGFFLCLPVFLGSFNCYIEKSGELTYVIEKKASMFDKAIFISITVYRTF